MKSTSWAVWRRHKGFQSTACVRFLLPSIGSRLTVGYLAVLWPEVRHFSFCRAGELLVSRFLHGRNNCDWILKRPLRDRQKLNREDLKLPSLSGSCQHCPLPCYGNRCQRPGRVQEGHVKLLCYSWEACSRKKPAGEDVWVAGIAMTEGLPCCLPSPPRPSSWGLAEGKILLCIVEPLEH